MTVDISTPEQFTGYAAYEKQGDEFDLKPYSYTPRAFTENDVDVKIIASGICGSDIHTLRSGWGAAKYPAIVGHEIVGTVVRAGKTSGHSLGDRIGFGAQCDSCQSCLACEGQMENFCKKQWTGTYQGGLKNGEYTQGGYADFYRGPGHFAVKIPDELPSDIAAPLLCAGVTVYAPLAAYGAGPGKRVGIIGIGGLGHLGLQFSKALGAETYAVSHSSSKKSDAIKMGADHFIETKDEKAVIAEYSQFFDILLCTSFQSDMPLESLYLPLLKPRGNMIIVGLPEDKFAAMRPQTLIGRSLTGSLIGSPSEIKTMLDVAVKHNVKTWIETRPMTEASKAVQDMHEGKARYRYVLMNEGQEKPAL